MSWHKVPEMSNLNDLFIYEAKKKFEGLFKLMMFQYLL